MKSWVEYTKWIWTLLIEKKYISLRQTKVFIQIHYNRPTYALIDKDDYYNSIPNYRLIEDLI